MARIREKIWPITTGLVVMLLLAAILYFRPGQLGITAEFLENQVYALQVRHAYQPISKNLPIAIVDIDDKSINAEGRWPWPREKVAQLVENFFTLGVSVAAFDIVFSEPEKNIVDELVAKLREEGKEIPGLEPLSPEFEYDKLLGDSLRKGTSVLGFFLTDMASSQGLLPEPLMILTPQLAKELYIPNYQNYTGNIPVLQQAATSGGVINASPDIDGVNRFAPLLLRQQDKLYPSLSLEATRLFLKSKQIHLLTEKYGDQTVLQGITLDNQILHTDPYGRILVPFRGPPYSIEYVSATDVLHGAVPREKLQGKLIFVGSSATALGDTVVTPIAPTFAGVEIHADIASGIIDHYLPYKPTWGKGVSVGLVLLFGLALSFTFPFFGPLGATLIALILPLAILAFDRWIWVQFHLFLSLLFPILIILLLYVINLIWGYVSEKRKREKSLIIFGQYIPKERIDTIMKQEGAINLEGEEKELSVLFADIRGFTAIAEKMSAKQVKDFLNLYLTPMTQIIFDHRGTIDKYVGDLIVAFWGAPLEDPQNAYDAIDAGLAMQRKIDELNIEFAKLNLPSIQVGVGVNTGMMNVGDMGSKFRLAYTVLGDAVNLASRLETICRFYDVRMVVGQETYQRTKDRFGFRKLDRVQVKGKTALVDIYQPLCLIEQCSTEMRSIAKLHDEAMETYLKRDWKQAAQLFERLLKMDPSSQHLYKIYLDRIAVFNTTPPGPEWTGAFILETK